MIYINHSYNRLVHTFTGESPFETCFGYLWLSPLDVVYGQQGGMREEIIEEVLKEDKFVVKIR
jgi:hypothetical protein